MNSATRRPNFFILGAQKSGTTWLSLALARQPGIYIPPEKELHYFNHHYDRGEEWYLSHFSRRAARAARAVGEATPNYLAVNCAENALAAERIGRLAPDARFIVILRDPVDRLLSAYKHHAARGRLPWRQGPDRHIADVLDGRLSVAAILDYGLYGAQLARYFDHFDRARFRVFIYEETLLVDPMAMLRDALSFLGLIGQEPVGRLPGRRNVTVETRAGIVATNVLSAWMWCDPVRRMAGSMVTGIGRAVDVLAGQEPFEPATDMRQRLEAYYAEDTERLRRLLGRAQMPWTAGSKPAAPEPALGAGTLRAA